jgi:hypothetical protein
VLEAMKCPYCKLESEEFDYSSSRRSHILKTHFVELDDIITKLFNEGA